MSARSGTRGGNERTHLSNLKADATEFDPGGNDVVANSACGLVEFRELVLSTPPAGEAVGWGAVSGGL